VSLKEALHQAETVIASHDIPDARLEAELLIMHSLGIGKVELYTRLNEPLSSSEAQDFWNLVHRRLRREPTAYITRQCSFYGIDLYVDSRVLIPRPESELLVETAVEFMKQRLRDGQVISVADVGTGSGAVAIALALYVSQAVVKATDISPEALDVARINCEKHRVVDRVQLLPGDMLEPVGGPLDVIVANLPYVRDSEIPGLMAEVRDFEPGISLSGGPDGLEKVGRLLPQAKGKLVPGGLLLLEIGQGQGEAAAALAASSFPTARVDLIPDLAGIDRVVRVLT